jgi:hypothetical protein
MLLLPIDQQAGIRRVYRGDGAVAIPSRVEETASTTRYIVVLIPDCLRLVGVTAGHGANDPIPSVPHILFLKRHVLPSDLIYGAGVKIGMKRAEDEVIILNSESRLYIRV